MTVTDIIASQLKTAGVASRPMKVDDMTIRVVTKRGAGGRWVDVRYDAGSDLYDVTVFHFGSAPSYNVTNDEPVVGLDVEQMVEVVRG